MATGRRQLQPQNFILLDGHRGLGAVLVLVGHMLLAFSDIAVPGGAVIVDLFFLLSGFVIAFWYEPRFESGMGAGEFILHRIVRLYPLYLLSIVLGFLLLLGATIGDADGAERSWMRTLQFLPELFVLPAPEMLGSDDVFPLNSPAWTLFFELLVNIVYVLAFPWLRNTRALAVVTMLCAVALIATVLAIGSIDAGSTWPTIWAGFSRAGFGFFAGVLAYRLLGRPATTQRPKSRWALVVLAAAPLVCLIPATRELRPFVDLIVVVGLGVPLLVLSQSIEPPKQFAALFTMGGRISYAVYILHQPLIEAAVRLSWREPRMAEMMPLLSVVVLVLVLLFAYCAERYFDRPARRWIVTMLKRGAAARAIARAQAVDPKSAAVPAE